MFIVHTVSKVYGLEFEHHVEETGYSSTKNKVKFTSKTTCNLFTRINNEWVLTQSYTAKFYPKDIFSLPTARKCALTHVIEEMKLPERTRREIWNGYFQLVGRPNRDAGVAL
jgi:hypothetical protein